MTQRILYPEWREQNETTKFPFSVEATLRNNAGKFFLEGTFLDAHLYPLGAVDSLYIKQITVSQENIEIIIADKDKEVCSGNLPTNSETGNITLTDKYGRPAGVLISDPIRLAIFSTWGNGNHLFTASQTLFATVCCTPLPAVGVRGFRLQDGSLWTGDTWLVGEDGVVFSVEQQSKATACDPEAVEEVIRVDVVGDPLFRRKLCVPQSLFNSPNPVRYVSIRKDGVEIALCQPEDGVFSILRNNLEASASVLRINSTNEGLHISVVGESATL